MTDNGFIVLLAFGAALLAGILTVAHVSAYRLNRRLEIRRHKTKIAADEPELDLGTADFGALETSAPRLTVQARHAETAR